MDDRACQFVLGGIGVEIPEDGRDTKLNEVA
jgi:hypothetical protein